MANWFIWLWRTNHRGQWNNYEHMDHYRNRPVPHENNITSSLWHWRIRLRAVLLAYWSLNLKLQQELHFFFFHGQIPLMVMLSSKALCRGFAVQPVGCIETTSALVEGQDESSFDSSWPHQCLFSSPFIVLADYDPPTSVCAYIMSSATLGDDVLAELMSAVSVSGASTWK